MRTCRASSTPAAARVTPIRCLTTRSAWTTRYATSGDRVAVVAAETPEIAREALKLIEVEYEVLPAVFDMEAAMQPGAPVIHDEPDTEGIHDARRNIVHHVDAAAGDAEAQWAKADFIFEGEYHTHQVQQAHIEPHVVHHLLGRGRPAWSCGPAPRCRSTCAACWPR